MPLKVAAPLVPVVVKVIGDWKSVLATAALIAVPLPFRRPVMLVVTVMAGVVVALATEPAKPFAEATDTVVTVPLPETVVFCLFIKNLQTYVNTY